FVEQGAQDHPVVGADGGGPVGAAGGVLVEGTGSPNVGAGAMDLGVIDGRDMVAVPDPTRGRGDQVGQGPGEAVEAVAGEGPSEGVEQGLPDGPGEFSFGHDASPVSGPVGFGTTWQVPTRRRCFSIRYARSVVVEFFVETTD